MNLAINKREPLPANCSAKSRIVSARENCFWTKEDWLRGCFISCGNGIEVEEVLPCLIDSRSKLRDKQIFERKVDGKLNSL